MVAVSSSAPDFPRRAKRSESLVNPEMSTNAMVPSSSWCVSSGVDLIHSMARRGKYGARG